MSISNIRLGPYTNDIFAAEHKHFVTLYTVADYGSGELQVREPEKCARWDWFDWNHLPQPLFLPVQNLLQEGFNPWRVAGVGRRENASAPPQ